MAERAASWYSPLVHILSFGAFGFWMWQTGGDWRYAINISAAVLIITCPCALGLAVPAVVTSASGKLFRKGLLIKDGTALERLAQVDHVVFDKTGTLTLGAPEPTNLATLPPEVAASPQPSPQAPPTRLPARWQTRPLAAEVTDLHEVPGYGIEARYQGKPVRLGRAEWVGAAPESVTATYLALAGKTYAFTFADHLRPGASAAIAALRAQGKAITLISGDGAGPVADLAARLGITDWHATALPAEKAGLVRGLTEAGPQGADGR